MNKALYLTSICVGETRSFAGDEPWSSAIFKEPVVGPCSFSHQGIAGDSIANRVNHGGKDKAVLAYSHDHYARWEAEMGKLAFGDGGFGENLAIAGLCEQTVCLGDRWRVGDVVLEISQPRQPCWKLNRKWNLPDLAKRVVQNGRSGWYLRVVQEGNASAGEALELLSRPHEAWSIARISELFYGKSPDMDAINLLREIPELAASWRDVLPLA